MVNSTRMDVKYRTYSLEDSHTHILGGTPDSFPTIVLFSHKKTMCFHK